MATKQYANEQHNYMKHTKTKNLYNWDSYNANFMDLISWRTNKFWILSANSFENAQQRIKKFF